MIYLRQPVRIWLTAAGAHELVPRVCPHAEFEAALYEEDHHGFWVESESNGAEGGFGTRTRLIRKEFVASIELGWGQEEQER